MTEVRVAFVEGADRARVEKLKRMTPDKIAPLVAFLGSDAAREVSGQIFTVRNNEIFLMSQPMPVRSIHSVQGWTPEALAELLPHNWVSAGKV